MLALAPDGSSAGAAWRLSLSPVWSQAGSSGSLLWAEGDGSVAEEDRPADFAADWVKRPATTTTTPPPSPPHGLHTAAPLP